MDRGAGRRSVWGYVLLVFALSAPFWLLGAVAERLLPRGIAINLPASAAMFVCPALAASILVYREGRWAGVGRLWRRAADVRAIPRKVWLLPALLLMPGLMLLEYGLLRALGVALPPFQAPALLPVLLVGFFLAAVLEELGWSGYALDPLQARWGALAAAAVLGAVWALWHSIPYLQAHHPPGWVAWQWAGTVATRVLLVWIYNNTGGSVFAASLLHAMYNVSFLVLFPVYGSHYDPAATFFLTALVATVVTLRWGPRTLARPRVG